MGRNLYRVYLYVVVIGALVNVAYWWFNWLRILFLPVPESHGDSPATAAYEAFVALGLSLLLGLSHYAWMRKDIEEDTAAGSGLVRGVTLNLAQAVAAVVALLAGIFVVQYVDQVDAVSHSRAAGLWATSLAAFIVAAAGFILVQVERLRTQPAPGPPLTAQRAHLYLVQSSALIAVFATWRATLAAAAGDAPCVVGAPCPTVAGYGLATFFAAEVWLLYFFLVRADPPSGLRLATQLFGFTAGLVCTIVGEWGAVAAILGQASREPADVPHGLTAPENFAAFLVFGVVVMVGYGLWLVLEADANPAGRAVTELTLLAVAALALGTAFYVAIVFSLTHLFDAVAAPAGGATGHVVWLAVWASALGLLVAGLAHPLMAAVLRLRSDLIGAAQRLPRQGFVLGGLAAGFLTIVFAFVLLQITIKVQPGGPGTSVIQHIERLPSAFSAAWNAFWNTLSPPCTVNCSSSSGSASTSGVAITPSLVLATVLVGAFIASIHWFRAFKEGWLPHLRFASKAAPPQPDGEVAHETPSALAAIVDDVAAGRITRDEALERLEARKPPPDSSARSSTGESGTFDT